MLAIRRILLSLAIVSVPAGLLADENPNPPATQPAATPNTLTDAERAAGWTLLFDGTTTAGWRGYKKNVCPPGWVAIDGTLDRVKKSGDLITVDQYASFELVLDWRISKAGNSGVMFHVVEDADRPALSGPEYQLLDNIDGEDPQRAGWCYALYQPPIDAKTGKPLDTTHSVGEWNTTRILIDGPHVEHWMNGVKYVEYELWSEDWNARVAKSKFASFPNWAKARSGHISLQDHGGEVAFRNIKIRVIHPQTSPSK